EGRGSDRHLGSRSLGCPTTFLEPRMIGVSFVPILQGREHIKLMSWHLDHPSTYLWICCESLVLCFYSTPLLETIFLLAVEHPLPGVSGQSRQGGGGLASVGIPPSSCCHRESAPSRHPSPFFPPEPASGIEPVM